MATLNLSEQDNGKTIDVQAGDTLCIRLRETPTTGYRWQATAINTQDAEMLSEEFDLAGDSGIGGGGTKTIQFKVLRKASGRLRLENVQPWSGDVYRTFEVNYR